MKERVSVDELRIAPGFLETFGRIFGIVPRQAITAVRQHDAVEIIKMDDLEVRIYAKLMRNRKQIWLLAFIAIASHPLLDFLNAYGMRWFMPFSERCLRRYVVHCRSGGVGGSGRGCVCRTVSSHLFLPLRAFHVTMQRAGLAVPLAPETTVDASD